MSIFIERTSVMKKVCIPCIPWVPWRILYEISGGALRETTLKILNSVCILRAPWGNSFPAVLLEDLVTGVNSANVLYEGLRIGGDDVEWTQS
jgi:hypothetical protein